MILVVTTTIWGIAVARSRRGHSLIFVGFSGPYLGKYIRLTWKKSRLLILTLSISDSSVANSLAIQFCQQREGMDSGVALAAVFLPHARIK